MSWSQIVQQTPGYGVTTSSGGVTGFEYLHRRYAWICGTSSRPQISPFWSIPPQEAPLPPGLPVSLLYQPPMGRASSLRATIDRQAQTLRAMAPQAPTSQAPTSQTPQMVPPLCQPLPSSGSSSASNPLPAGGATTK